MPFPYNPSPNTETAALIVCGGGVLAGSSILSRALERAVAENGLDGAAINGRYDEDGQAFTKPAAMQEQEIIQCIEQRSDVKNVLLIAHCLGTIAAMNAAPRLQQLGVAVRFVALSPSLPSPVVMRTNPVLAGRRKDSTTAQMYEQPEDCFDPTSLRAVQVTMPDAYIRDIEDASDDYEQKLQSAVQSGMADIIVGTCDWNQQAVTTARTWQELFQTDALQHGAVTLLEGTGHSITQCDERKSDTERIAQLRTDCTRIVAQGIAPFAY